MDFISEGFFGKYSKIKILVQTFLITRKMDFLNYFNGSVCAVLSGPERVRYLIRNRIYLLHVSKEMELCVRKWEFTSCLLLILFYSPKLTYWQIFDKFLCLVFSFFLRGEAGDGFFLNFNLRHHVKTKSNREKKML